MARRSLTALAPLCISLPLVLPPALGAQGTRLLRHPGIHGDAIVFAHGGDLWITTRAGGATRRLTATPDVESDPHFSPDGSLIAFSRTTGGNTDVYVVPAAGGEPRRLTYHPQIDRATGWTRDGKAVVFASDRGAVPQSSYLRLWTVSVEGGLEKPLAMPRAVAGSYSPDARRFAYDELPLAFTPDWYENSFWRHYRGGRTQPIRIFDLASNAVEKLPWKESNDHEPVWIGNDIYFLSDRAGAINIFSYDLGTKQLKQLTHHDDFDVMNLSADDNTIVYEQAGYLHVLDPKTGQSRQLAINVVGDFPWARAQFKRVASMIRDAALSPSGVRAAFEARGEIFTVPADKGDWRDLSKSSGAHDANPAWSPDGSRIAWTSDASGEWQIMIGDQTGLTKPRAIDLPALGYYSNLSWSPNGKFLLATDSHLNLWMIDVAAGNATKLDSDTYDTPGRDFDAVWSPDSRWVAYSRSLDNHLRAIFLRALSDPKPIQLTDGLADAMSPAFDASGKYLGFLASTDYGPRTGWVEMSAVDRPVRRAIYLAVLSATEPSPLLPESGDEGAPASAPRPRADSVIRVDPGLAARIISLEVPAGDLSSLSAGPAGAFFYLEAVGSGGAQRLQRYQLRDRAPTTFLEGIRSYTLSGDRKKLLYTAGGGANARWGIVSTDKPAHVGDGALNVSQLEAWIDPRAEWAEIFHEGWRNQRDYFYDPRMHGADWQAVWKKYAPMLESVDHRADLSYLMAQTGGELTVGHSYLLGGGDVPGDPATPVGLLGADYSIENGHCRITRIFTGENWNPELRAPLRAPGIHVDDGDYLLEVNGRPLTPQMNVYQAFEGTAGHQTVIRVNSSPSLEGSRIVTVIPIPSEDALRTRAWIEDNRRKVEQLSGGRIGYVWLPNTSIPGYNAFTRYFYAQQDKDGVVIDERYNHGSLVADFIVNELDRRPMGYFAMRDGKPFSTPAAGVFGPKVMIINESAGSGGDALPYYFKLRKLGPLVGTRTWGALVGTTGVPTTIDGGGITAPSLAFYDLKGRWAVENEGITPDIEVEYTPADVIRGHDPQLERAVAEALKLLERDPVKRVGRPAPIDRVHP